MTCNELKLLYVFSDQSTAARGDSRTIGDRLPVVFLGTLVSFICPIQDTVTRDNHGSYESRALWDTLSLVSFIRPILDTAT